MKTLSYLSLCLLLSLSTSSQQIKRIAADESPEVKKVAEIVKSVQQRFAPDQRVAVFDVSAMKNESLIILKGEIGSSDAKAELLAAIRSVGISNIQDSIALLPDAAAQEKPYGIVTVSVSPMRAKPSETAEMVTQALMGSVVKVLKQKRGWAYVQTMEENYLGWMDNAQFVQENQDEYARWVNGPLVITTAYIELVYMQPSDSSQPLCDVTAGALLSGKEYNSDWFSVSLADGRAGFLTKKSAMEYGQWKTSRTLTPDNIEKTAKRFLGVPYLWGGTSPKGFDCSGFAKTAYKLNGMVLPRDADQQGLEGENVSLENDLSQLRKGDLLFFGDKGTKEKPERITHVGIYLGHKEFIHCSGLVKFNSFDPSASRYSEYLLSRLVKAKRFIPIQ